MGFLDHFTSCYHVILSGRPFSFHYTPFYKHKFLSTVSLKFYSIILYSFINGDQVWKLIWLASPPKQARQLMLMLHNLLNDSKKSLFCSWKWAAKMRLIHKINDNLKHSFLIRTSRLKIAENWEQTYNNPSLIINDK